MPKIRQMERKSKFRPRLHNKYIWLTPTSRMSREEREEAYNKARERIFGTANTDASTPGMDAFLLISF